jgi:hypothetical protein
MMALVEMEVGIGMGMGMGIEVLRETAPNRQKA